MKLALVAPILLFALALPEETEYFRWRGNVDGIDDILIKGSRVRIEHVAAKPIQNQDQRFSAPLPFAEVELNLEVIQGRGSVRLMEQPSQRNQYTAVVRVDDQDHSGDDRYEFELSWSREDLHESRVYESTFRWRGRVDIGCDIEVQGKRHIVKDAGGSGTREKGATFSEPLPRSEVPVSVEKRDGRGDVEIIQTPDSSNGYTAILRIEDSKSGSDDYDIELRWPRQ
ncbi:MAG TPA: hypothetical protein VJ921_10270 [Vicinamibacteria bacterium]|nr:hypothetical protein [Vicinamibacteria bacterium]